MPAVLPVAAAELPSVPGDDVDDGAAGAGFGEVAAAGCFTGVVVAAGSGGATVWIDERSDITDTRERKYAPSHSAAGFVAQIASDGKPHLPITRKYCAEWAKIAGNSGASNFVP